MGIDLTQHPRSDQEQLFDYNLTQACIAGKVYKTLQTSIYRQLAYTRQYKEYPVLASRLIPFMKVSGENSQHEVMKEVSDIVNGNDKTFVGTLQYFFVSYLMGKRNRSRLDRYIKKHNKAQEKLYLVTKIVEYTKTQVQDCIIYLIDDTDYHRVVDEQGLNPFHELSGHDGIFE